jgi:hypothetical protein
MRMKLNLQKLARDGSRPHFEPDQLPMTFDEPKQRGVGCVVIAFAAIWGGIPGIALVQIFLRDGFKWPMLAMALFPLIAMSMILFGLSQFWRRRLVRLEETFVAVKARGVFKSEQWREEMSSYQGVLFATESRSRGKSSYTVWVVKLVHPNAKHSIQLTESMREDGQRKLAETWAKRLNLPALEKDGSGQIRERHPEQLDDVIKDRVIRGEVKVHFDPQRRPPEGITLNRRPDQVWEIWYQPALAAWWSLPIFLLIPGGMIYLGFFHAKRLLPIGIFGIVFMAIVLAVVILSRKTRYLIELRPGVIYHGVLAPWGRMGEKTLACGDIEDISIGRGERSNQPMVKLVTDEASIEVGLGCSAEVREWLRDCLTWHAARD